MAYFRVIRTNAFCFVTVLKAASNADAIEKAKRKRADAWNEVSENRAAETLGYKAHQIAANDFRDITGPSKCTLCGKPRNELRGLSFPADVWKHIKKNAADIRVSREEYIIEAVRYAMLAAESGTMFKTAVERND